MTFELNEAHIAVEVWYLKNGLLKEKFSDHSITSFKN